MIEKLHLTIMGDVHINTDTPGGQKVQKQKNRHIPSLALLAGGMLKLINTIMIFFIK